MALSTYKSPSLVNIECKFNKPEQTFFSGDLISGNIVIEPYYDLNFKSISYSICYTIGAPGYEKQEKIVHSEVLNFTSTSWKKDGKYGYPFQKKINQPTSYRGELFNIRWKIIFHIEFTNDVKEVIQEIRSHYKDFNSHNLSVNLTKGFGFRIKPGQKKHTTVATTVVFMNEKLLPFFVISMLIGVVGVIFNLQEVISFPIPIFEIIGSASIIFGIQHFIFGFGKFEKITFEVLPNQAGQPYFPVKFIVDEKWSSIKYFNASYSVYEKKYTYGNRSSKSHSQRKINQLEESIQEIVIGKETILFLPFPKDMKIPVSLNYRDYQIEWEMDTIIQLKNGRKKKYRFSFLTVL